MSFALTPENEMTGSAGALRLRRLHRRGCSSPMPLVDESTTTQVDLCIAKALGAVAHGVLEEGPQAIREPLVTYQWKLKRTAVEAARLDISSTLRVIRKVDRKIPVILSDFRVLLVKHRLIGQ